MTETHVPSGRYFEDFVEGDVFITPARTVTESDVVQFAGLSGDNNPLHTDEHFAQSTQFGSRVAHGLLGLSIASGLVSRLGIFDGTAVAMLSVESWNFNAPIRLGETVHVRATIAAKRRTNRGDRGVISRHMALLSSAGETLQEGTIVLLVKCRSATDD